MTRQVVFLLPLQFVFFSGYYLRSQTTLVDFSTRSEKDSTKRIYAYTSLQAALKVNPDSVQGLIIMSSGCKDFPQEILKFRNLRYLRFGAYYWSDVLDSLTWWQKKRYYRMQKKSFDGFVAKKYKLNEVRTIPEGIKNLKKLEFVTFYEGTRILRPKEFIKIYHYLPNAKIFPLLDEILNP